ncbi:UvrD-helicase domain-containing protein [Rhodanobacter glycinis]|uniref:UvrD-helicase domain-containing protein n=1 Tax=Rhodanobacter glycinis TaxID=582702 RepID=UPI00112D5BBF|nr:UvrD-helicase domain-containing protein [Rhodanobacter glycinis]
MEKFIFLSESAIDVIVSGKHARDSKIPATTLPGLRSKNIGADVLAFATGREHEGEFCALIDIASLKALKGDIDAAYTRIARVLKSAAKPPVHLPRGWAEFHFKSRLAFFAVGEDEGNQRWLADIDSGAKLVRFLGLTDDRRRIDLKDWVPPVTPDIIGYSAWVEVVRTSLAEEAKVDSFAEQVDLEAIGSDAVVQGYSYEYWLTILKAEQERIVNGPLDASVRVIGPAGSGKTLTLCMRAIRLSRDESVIGGRKKILIVTHSWAMTERIDGILHSLNDGRPTPSISVLPLLYILQTHAGNVGQMASAVLGEDSADGQRRVMELLDRFLGEVGAKIGTSSRALMSPHIVHAIDANQGSLARNELVLDLYEEVIGILSPQGVMPGDSDRVAEYLIAPRDETMPPFFTRTDRELCLRVFERLMEQLVDLGAITTDQLVLDCIRVFETFSWNVKRETDGYDYILIDELQLFDAQERLAVSLLSRAKPGMVFLSVEDPSQGMFSAVNDRSEALRAKDRVYLEETHRFRAGLFEFISYLYGRFPLNAAAIKVARSDSKVRKPRVVQLSGDEAITRFCVEKAKEVAASKEKGRRVCVVCVSAAEGAIFTGIKNAGLPVIRLESFDDVELLSYQRRAAVVSSWQFIGGTQFSDVVLVVSGLVRATNAHAKLRELTAIYLGASRASSVLDIVCDTRIPDVLQSAIKERLVTKS